MKNKVIQEMQAFEAQISLLTKRQMEAPDGHLRVSENKGRAQYYQVQTVGDTHGKYIRKKDRAIAEALAQKEYDAKVLREAQTQLSILGEFLEKYNKNPGADIYEKLNAYRKELVRPVVATDADFVKRWLEEPYEGRGFEVHEPEYRTKRGERVRSKSEVLIANMLYDAEIPYLYERPININGRNVYIDFTLLEISTRKTIYWEHFGLMDNPSYVEEVLWKLSNYARNGIVLGKNLLASFESTERPLDIQAVGKMIQELR